MKTLYLVRHAKSSWDHAGLADFDRPLNDRGKRDAPKMGSRLKERHIHPGMIMSSPAKRAYATSKRIAEVLGYAKENIRLERALYHANDDELLTAIRKAPDTCESLMIFGHNPGITDLANNMTRNQAWIRNIPTCGVVAYRFDTRTWKEIDPGKGEFIFFDFPKNQG